MWWKEENQLDTLDALRRGFEESGIWRLLGIRVQSLSPGELIIRLDLNDSHLNYSQGVHGGVMATLHDCAMGLTLRSIDDSPYVTQSLTTYFLAAPRANDTLIAFAKLLRKGRRIVTMQGSITDSEERLISHALATFVKL